MSKSSIPLLSSRPLDLPSDLGFEQYEQLVRNASAVLKINGKKYGLSKVDVKSLEKITTSEITVLAKALKLAAEDGLTTQEIHDIMKDSLDLIHKASTNAKFTKMLENPSNAKYKLTKEVATVISQLSDEEKSQLQKDLKLQALSPGDKVLNFLEHHGGDIVLIVKVLVNNIIEVGIPLLKANAGKLIPGSEGAIAAALDFAKGALEKDISASKVTEKTLEIAKGITTLLHQATPAITTVVTKAAGENGETIAKQINVAIEGSVHDLEHLNLSESVALAGDAALDTH
jgi:hypothetical protein